MFSKLIEGILNHYKPKEIFLYGSYATGKQTEHSDIDLCILMPEDWQGKRYDFNLNKILTALIGKEVHCVFCTRLNGWCVKSIYKSND